MEDGIGATGMTFKQPPDVADSLGKKIGVLPGDQPYLQACLCEIKS